MLKTWALETTDVSLSEAMEALAPGEEITLTRNDRVVGRLVSDPASASAKRRPAPGLGKGMITFIAPDFDGPLDGMSEYLG